MTARTAAAPLLAALLLAASAARAQEKPPEAPPPPAAGPAGEPAAAPKDPVGEARRLHAEAKEYFAVAGDTDLPRDERKKARKEAYPRLQKAKQYLDDWFVDHPDDADRHQEMYKDISIMLYWIRKEAGVGELDGTESKPKPRPAAPAPDPTGAGARPPEPPKPPTAAESLAKIRDYEKAHPGDVPGLHEQYTAFLAAYSDPASPEYDQASRRLEELGKELKDVYRLARDDDPDALSGSDPAEVERLVDQLSPDLKSPEIAVRERAARYLGNLGSGRAAPALVDALLAEKEPAVLESVKEALSRLGGRRVCDRLAREKPGSANSPLVVDVLLRIVKRGGVNARIAGETVGHYAPGLDETARAEIASGLAAAGKDAAVGLALVVDGAPVDKKVEYLDLLGQWAVPRTAGYLTRFLMTNPQGARRAQHQAARRAIEAIGKPGVRWLIPALDDKNCTVWTAEMLKQITGAKLERGDFRRRSIPLGSMWPASSGSGHSIPANGSVTAPRPPSPR